MQKPRPDENQGYLLIYKEYLEEILEHREQFDLKKFEEKQGISFDYSMHHSKNLRHLGI